MFDKYFEKRRKIKEIKEKFLKEHDLPRYSPVTGIPLRWEIKVIQNGPYDINTGEALGEFEVIIKQIIPSCSEIMRDRTVYVYNIEEKKLEIDESYMWTL